MKTGEGKTLTSTMPVYLNALSGKGVHIVTVNEYLASRDAEEMGKIFEFLGLTVGLNLNSLDKDEKEKRTLLISRIQQTMSLALIIYEITWCCIKSKWFKDHFIMPSSMKLTPS